MYIILSMLKWKIVASGFVVILVGWCLFHCYAEKMFCGNDEKIIICAYRHPSIQYLNEFQSYPVLDQALETVKGNACDDLEFLTATLAVGIGYTPRHAHYTEEMAEISDKIISENTECFIKSILRMSKEDREKFDDILQVISGDGAHFKSAGTENFIKVMSELSH